MVGLVLGMIVWLANNSNPPNGKTAAPFDGNCNDCHSGSAYSGTVEVTGFPGTADPNIVYDINIKLTVTSGSPVKGGFQLVVVDGNNNNCGDLVNINGNGTGTEMFGGREYMEHRNGKAFSGGVVSWDFQWKAPPSGVAGNTIKVYFIGNFTNGNNNSSGDNPEWSNTSFSFAGNPPVTASISSSANPTCNGAHNGSATVEPGGGITPYTYAWSNGQTDQTAVNLGAGTYTVTVTGASNSGTATASVTLSQPTALTLTTNVTGSVTCVNIATATATGGGGTPGYSYDWSDGQTGSIATFDQTGTYTVTLSDQNGCTKTASVSITGNTTTPIAVAGDDRELSCTVLNTTLNGQGSSTGPTFTYLWTTTGGHIVSGGTSLTPTVDACGVYQLTVTNNANGCTATATVTVVCNQSQPNASAVGGSIDCNQNSITLQGNSTTPGVNYTWTGPGITPTNQFLQNPVVNLTGLYTLTVTNPDNGCTKTATATVSGNVTAPTANATVSGPLTCIQSTVTLHATTNAQTPTYSWSGPDNFTSGSANPTTGVPGLYTVVITNGANGCTNSASVTVNQDIVLPGASASATGQITCAVDSSQLLGNSPAAPNVTYSWTGTSYNSNLQNPVVHAAGTYTLVVTGNANGCTSSAVATVTQNKVAPFDSIAPHGNLNCNNASIQLNATPSSQGLIFKYKWTVKNGGHIVLGDTTLTPTVDSTGKYFLTITNTENGCKSLDSTKVNLSAPVTAAVDSSVNVSCNGGNNGLARAHGGGGNGVFDFEWTNGDSIAITSNLTAGTYIVVVTDGENCSATASVTINQPSALAANASATGETALNAHNGTATANPSGGTPGYTYAWSNGASTQSIQNLAPGIYTVSITDANGCAALQSVTVNAFGCNVALSITGVNVSCNGAGNGSAQAVLTGTVNPVTYAWSNGSTSQQIVGLSPGLYSLNIVDGANCPGFAQVNISEPPVLAANASSTDVSANGANDGTASATPTGGTPAYTYAWSTGATTPAIQNLAPGAYTVIVTDANGCTAQQTVNVSAFNCAISASFATAQVSCFGGSDGQATVAVQGGTLPYTYQWSNGAVTQTIGNLTAGAYTVTAVDGSGCAITEGVSITQPTVLELLVVSVQNVICPQDHTGSATLSATGGTAPYSFAWPGGNTGDLGVGSYTVSLTDAHGCQDEAVVTIIATDNEPPVITCPANVVRCGAGIVEYPLATATDNCTNSANIPIGVGGPPSGSFLDFGTHTVVFIAVDGLGNSSSCNMSILVRTQPEITLDNVVNDKNDQGLGAISVSVSGAGGYTFNWVKDGAVFANTEDLSGLHQGKYTLIVTDQFGCSRELGPIEVSNTVGAFEPSEGGSVTLMPNPASNTIQLEAKNISLQSAVIYDLQGKFIQAIGKENIAEPIDIQSLPEGVYCIRLNTSAGRSISMKFIVQRG